MNENYIDPESIEIVQGWSDDVMETLIGMEYEPLPTMKESYLNKHL